MDEVLDGVLEGPRAMDARPQERIREIPAEVLDFIPERELQLDSKRFAECLRSAPSGSALGMVDVPKIFCVCLDHRDTLLLLTKAAEDFARVVPVDVFLAFMTATMTALEKRDGGVRGQDSLARSRGIMFPFPVCPFHTHRSGLCGTCGASHDRRRPSCHGVVGRRDWCKRPCAPRVNDYQIGSSRVARVVAVRQSFIQITFALHLGGRSRTEPRDSATRRRRTRRPFNAAAV